jgi:DNA-binding IclR family transcriptional regulator
MEATARVVTALNRLKEPFLAVPGTEMSLSDAASLSGLDSNLCGLLLNALVDRRFLTVGADGAYRLRCTTSEEPVAYA